MTEFDAETEIEALIETFAAGFDDYDAEAILACFAYPAVIWQFDKGHVFASPEEMAENVDALLKVYEEAGIALSSFDVVEVSVQGGSAVAAVSWEQEDADGIVVMEFSAAYHLVRRDDTWRIAMIVNDAEDEDVEGEEAEDDGDA